ncbi:cysteine-rich motor neuron 1 protein-like [Copidosoma floridanum]|uniref:cysteine-rich motor neuron 1 protein-like n=1 Tax=Copidosoma floridanum TaxID=29053 RepID=UPI000C6FB0F3|nr:cysteine-rich motor neuron 1 protein-like [Copidosoma floridanum]
MCWPLQNEVMEEDDDDEEDDEEDEDGLDEDDECPESQQSCNLSCQWGFLMDSRGCVFCQCRPRPDCPAIIDCDLECPQGFTMDELGCPTCRCLDSCLDERNVTHLEGARWRTDYCRSCSCEPGGRIFCNETICAVACGNPLPPPPGKCCPICPTPSVLEQWRGWSTLPIILIVSLTLLCILLMVHLVCGRFRGRLVPSEAEFMGFPHHQQYYKCVPIYETHVPVLQHAEKVVPL